MGIRKILEPNLNIAAELYPIVKKKIREFTEFWENNPDEAIAKHKEVEAALKTLTGKDMSAFDLWEYWEADGLAHLAFRISLPQPVTVDDFMKAELIEVVRRITTFEPPIADKNDDFLQMAWAHASDYYKALLQVNFETYDSDLFSRHKDQAGNYFEYTVEEIVEKMWDG